MLYHIYTRPFDVTTRTNYYNATILCKSMLQAKKFPQLSASQKFLEMEGELLKRQQISSIKMVLLQ